MNKIFTENGWKDYLYWQSEDKETLKRINRLIKDISKNGHKDKGRAEALYGDMSGFWSRRVNDRDRVIYKVEKNNIFILSCRYHY